MRSLVNSSLASGLNSSQHRTPAAEQEVAVGQQSARPLFMDCQSSGLAFGVVCNGQTFFQGRGDCRTQHLGIGR